ncbi:copper-binding protein [Candidimonas nitroreducens]|jgi:Cu/Ag efflux protein CusF|uniref:RND transporter MFP subunit n=1 Tax=Candidimonas nitroreducens TaxID=683354 RepID=A0A225MYH8_9BURK|nr:copper-binding protein [Candidimonas nitroreducens]OWT65573.1 RND transporter MFP subunit [Candidimonas nitroreducens]
MNKLMVLSTAACLAFGLWTSANAAGDMQTNKGTNTEGNRNSTKSVAPADIALADGVVRKVDRQAGMVTIQHGELKIVGMPPMTMAYKAKDAAMANRAKEGEKIRFRLENVNGTYIITKLEKQ